MANKRYWKFLGCPQSNASNVVWVESAGINSTLFINSGVLFKISGQSDFYGYRLSSDCIFQSNFTGGPDIYRPISLEGSNPKIITASESSFTALQNCNPEEVTPITIQSCKSESGCSDSNDKLLVYLGAFMSNLTSGAPANLSVQDLRHWLNNQIFTSNRGSEGECFKIVPSEQGGVESSVFLYTIKDWSNTNLKYVGRGQSTNCYNCGDSSATDCYSPTPTPKYIREDIWWYTIQEQACCTCLGGKPVRDEINDPWIVSIDNAIPGKTYSYLYKLEYQGNESHEIFNHDWTGGSPAAFENFTYYEKSHCDDLAKESSLLNKKRKLAYSHGSEYCYYRRKNIFYSSGAEPDNENFPVSSNLDSNDPTNQSNGDKIISESDSRHDYICIKNAQEDFYLDTSGSSSGPESMVLKTIEDGAVKEVSISDVGTGVSLLYSNDADIVTVKLYTDYRGKHELKQDEATLSFGDTAKTLSAEATNFNTAFDVKVEYVTKGSAVTGDTTAPGSESCYHLDSEIDVPAGVNPPGADSSAELISAETNGNCYWQCNRIPGCTDSRACNYDSSANKDDGSCSYSECYGCNDPEAYNFGDYEYDCTECPSGQNCCDQYDICAYATTPTPEPTPTPRSTPTPTPRPTPTPGFKVISLSECYSSQLLRPTGHIEQYSFEDNSSPQDEDGNIIGDGDVLAYFGNANPSTPLGCYVVSVSEFGISGATNYGMWEDRSGLPVYRGYACPNNSQLPCYKDCAWYTIKALKCDCEGSISGTQYEFKSKDPVASRGYFKSNEECFVVISSTESLLCDFHNSPLEEILDSDIYFGAADPCGDCMEQGGFCTPTPTENKKHFSTYAVKYCLEEDFEHEGFIYNGCDPEKWGEGRECFPFHPEKRGKFKSDFGEYIEDGYYCIPGEATAKIDVIDRFFGTEEEWIQNQLEFHNISQYNKTSGCGCSCS